MIRKTILGFALNLIASAAVAQVTPAGPWTPANPNGGTVTLIASTVSANAALNTGGLNQPAPLAYVCNLGPSAAYVTFGAFASLTAVYQASGDSGFPVPAGDCSIIDSHLANYVAAVTQSGGALLTVSSGTGAPVPAADAQSPWTPINPDGASVTLLTTTTSGAVAFAVSPAQGGAPAPVAYVCNIGVVNTAYITTGINANPPTATVASGFPIPASTCYIFNSFQQNQIAAITQAGTTTLVVASGSGNPNVTGPVIGLGFTAPLNSITSVGGPNTVLACGIGGCTNAAASYVTISSLLTVAQNAGQPVVGIGSFGPIGSHPLPQGWIQFAGKYGQPIYVPYY